MPRGHTAKSRGWVAQSDQSLREKDTGQATSNDCKQRVLTSMEYRNPAPGWGPGEARHKPRRQGWGGQGRAGPDLETRWELLTWQDEDTGQEARRLALSFSERA